jgi:pantoate--beta-alanine ligase
LTLPVVLQSPADMTAWSESMRAQGKRISFVPTMGFLHQGHQSLLKAGRARADLLVMSLFVNPTQFGPNEDLDRYPRDLQGDLEKAAAEGTDVVFAPQPDSMYPAGYETFIELTNVTQGLCGDRRPGHFRGVATVVAKLFNIVRPHVALFGEKDFQQLAVIRHMVSDLNMGIEIVGLPTIRESDGLAMSSRNKYLNDDERQRALSLSRALQAAVADFQAGETNAAALRARAYAELSGHVDRLEYLELRDAESLQTIAEVVGPAAILVAAYVGKTRLIDNMRLG